MEFTLVLPIMLFVLMGILDFARIYTTMMAVESAAREAADYGTTLGAGKWQAGAPMDQTVTEMQRRACVATRDLPDYTDSDADPANGCTNPSFTYCMTASTGGPCAAVDPTLGCEDPLRATPCTLTVTLTHDFRLLAPIGIDFYGLHFGFPTSIAFERDSTFAMTDIDLSVPGP
ncbi:MAG: pilus assembly protein [Chloroflexi bacterium]|nr:pilus assembly protein [Chloroflexota bacterium]